MTQMRRTVPSALITLFNTETRVQVADLYTITLVGGDQVFWTGADVAVTVDSQAWLRGPGISREYLEFRQGVDTQTAEVTITATPEDLFNGQALLPFILRGGFDGAKIQISQAYAGPDGVWQGYLERFTGFVAQVETGGRGEVKVSVASIMEVLNRQLPPAVFQAQCKNSLYDSTCDLDRDDFAVSGAATGPSTGGRLRIPHALSQDAGWFDLGAIVFGSGANQGVRRTVRQHTSGELILMQPLPAAVEEGDTFTVWAGCNLTRATCIAKFDNLRRFRGEPFVPPPETVT